jgi:hypothetical protein
VHTMGLNIEPFKRTDHQFDPRIKNHRRCCSL